jgi:TonB family protein
MRALRRSLPMVFLLAGCPLALQAQVAPPPTDTPISELASRIGEQLKKSHAKKIVVADLTGPRGQAHPAGKWLADQLSRDLAASFPALGVLDRPQPQPFSSEEHSHAEPSAMDLTPAQLAARDWARLLGATVVITGSFASVPDGVSISLKALKSSGAVPSVAEEWSVIPANAISALSEEPLPSVSQGIPATGRNGFTVPKCIYCPVPHYTNDARSQKLMGSVVLQVTVTADGKLTNIYVWKSLGGGLDTQAAKVMSTWKLEPAVGPDGKPTAVTTPIEVTFRLY